VAANTGKSIKLILIIWVLNVLIFVSALSCKVKPENPFDPDTPLDLKAKAILSGRVLLSDSTDRSGVVVKLLETGRGTTTGADGIFRIASLDPGTYTIRFQKAGYRTETRIANMLMGEEHLMGDIYLKDLTPPDPPRINEKGGRVDLQTECDGSSDRKGCVAQVKLTVHGGPFTYASACNPNEPGTTFTSDGNGSFAFEAMGGAQYNDWTRVCYDQGIVFMVNEDEESRLRIRKVDPEGNASSDDFIVLVEDSTPPAPPQVTSVIEGRDDVRISWNKGQDDDIAGYRLYYGAARDSLFGAFAVQGSSPIDMGDVTEFTLSGLNPGSQVFFALSSLDIVGHEGRKTVAFEALPNYVTPEQESLVVFDRQNRDDHVLGQVLLNDDRLVTARGRLGISVLDLTDPKDPVLTASGLEPLPALGLCRFQGHLLVASGPGGLCLVPMYPGLDADGPVFFEPSCMGAESLGLSDLDLSGVASNGRHVVAINRNGPGESGLVVLDGSDPADLKLESVRNLNSEPATLAISGDLVFVGYAGAVRTISVFDISDPVVPRLAAEVRPADFGMRNVSKILIQDDRLFLAGGTQGLAIMHIDRAKLLDAGHDCGLAGDCLELSGIFDTSDSVVDVDGQGGLILMAGKKDGLLAIEASDPSNPTLLGRAGAAEIEGAGSMAERVSMAGTNAVVAVSPPGIETFELGGPRTPKPLASVPTEGLAKYVTLKGRCALVATGTGKVQAVDMADPVNPASAGVLDVQPEGKSIDKIEINGDLAMAVSAASGLYILDVSNSCTPEYLGAWRPGQILSDVLPMPGSMLLASLEDREVDGTIQPAGLALVDIKDPANPFVAVFKPASDLGIEDSDSIQLQSMLLDGAGNLWIIERRAGASDSEFGLYKGAVGTKSGGLLSCRKSPGDCLPGAIKKVDIPGLEYPDGLFGIGHDFIGVLDLIDPDEQNSKIIVLSGDGKGQVAALNVSGQVNSTVIDGDYLYLASGNLGMQAVYLGDFLESGMDCRAGACRLTIRSGLSLEDEVQGLFVYGTWLLAAQGKAGLGVIELE